MRSEFLGQGTRMPRRFLGCILCSTAASLWAYFPYVTEGTPQQGEALHLVDQLPYAMERMQNVTRDMSLSEAEDLLGREMVARAKNQEKIVTLILEGRGWVYYDWHPKAYRQMRDTPIHMPLAPVLPGTKWQRELLGNEYFQSIVAVRLGRNFGDEHLRWFGNYKGLEELWLLGGGFTDAGLAQLVGCTRLRELTLIQTRVSDAGFVSLGKIDSLTTLAFEDSRHITGAGLGHLRKLRHLESLVIRDCPIDEKHYSYLKELATLETLDISLTPKLTPEGLGYLRQIESLRSLYIPGDGLRGQDIEQLRRSIPGCRIVVSMGSRASPPAVVVPKDLKSPTSE